MTIGPLSVALDAELLQFYKKGVFKPIFCSKTALDHGNLKQGIVFQVSNFFKSVHINSWTLFNSINLPIHYNDTNISISGIPL